MKTALLTLLFLSICSAYAEDQNSAKQNGVKKNPIETRAGKSPCEIGPETQACKDFLKKAMDKYPCANDVIKYCTPKDLTNSALIKNVNLDVMNKCLGKNMNKLSKGCQKSLVSEIDYKECMDKAASRCTGLKPDKEIECMSDIYSKELIECKKIKINQTELISVFLWF